jgi:hypothetical protein
MWCRVFNSSIFNSTSSHISSKFISCSIWKIKRSRDSKRIIIFVLLINLLIITLIFVFEFINSMILTTSSIMIFVLKNSQTYYCSFFLRNRSRSDEIDMKFDNVFVKENFEKDLLNKRSKDDDFDQRKNDLSIF